MHDRSADGEVFVELVLQVSSKQALPLHREGALILQPHVHVRSALEDRGVQDRYRSHRVIDGIIDVLDERRTSGGHGDRTSRYVHCAQADLAAVGAFVFTGEVEFILLAQLLRYHQGRVVQLLIAVFLHEPRVVAQRVRQMASERLQNREDDLTAARINGQTLDEVEATIRAGVMFLVQTVEVHDADQLLAADRTLVQVLDIRAHRIVAVCHVQFKFLLLNTGCAERVDVLHHQVPRAAVLNSRRVCATLQHLQRQRVRRPQFLSAVRSELAHLIDLAVVGVLICHSKHLILVQRALEGDIS